MLTKILPILDWLPKYKKANLKGDLSAGITVGIMLIPQGMAYAMIAGLPPVYGLYASFIPQLVYLFFGTSRQLAVGPVAMDSLIVAASVSAIADIGTDQFIELAILLAFLMGTIQFLAGILKLGFIVKYLSKPVISGFTSAAALIIGINQLKHLIGVDLERTNNVINILAESINRLYDIHYITFLIGAFGIFIIILFKQLRTKLPGSLVSIILGTLIVFIYSLDNEGVKIVGIIPEGFPLFKAPSFDRNVILQLLPTAFTLSIIAFVEAISVAKAIQAKHENEYELDCNQEFIALGLGNIIGSFFMCYPTTGGFSRSAVNDQAGAKSNLASLFSAIVIILTLLFLTPLFYYLPNALLGSIIMVAVFGLIDFKLPLSIWKLCKLDFISLIITFITTLCFGIVQGIATGVIINIIFTQIKTKFPQLCNKSYYSGKISNVN